MFHVRERESPLYVKDLVTPVYSGSLDQGPLMYCNCLNLNFSNASSSDLIYFTVTKRPESLGATRSLKLVCERLSSK